MCQGTTPPNVTLTGPFRHLIGTILFGAMAHFVYCVTLSVQEIPDIPRDTISAWSQTEIIWNIRSMWAISTETAWHPKKLAFHSVTPLTDSVKSITQIM